MRICYVDEAGCTGVIPTSASLIQPVFVVAGVVIDQASLPSITDQFLKLKRRFFPGSQIYSGVPPVAISPPFFLDWVLAEIKGANIRRNIWNGGRNLRRQTIGFLDRFVNLLQDTQVRIMGRVLIKGIGTPIDSRSLYTTSIQTIFATFQNYLQSISDSGFVIVDGRTKSQNVTVAHSLFTQKFQASGDSYPRVMEMPTFGNSDNHIGIQIADLLCSSLLFPIASHSYCMGQINNVHVQAAYNVLRTRYGATLKDMQHRYLRSDARWTGGIVVNDQLSQQSGSHLFG